MLYLYNFHTYIYNYINDSPVETDMEFCPPIILSLPFSKMKSVPSMFSPKLLVKVLESAGLYVY